MTPESETSGIARRLEETDWEFAATTVRECRQCGATIPAERIFHARRGRAPAYCSDRCRRIAKTAREARRYARLQHSSDAPPIEAPDVDGEPRYAVFGFPATNDLRIAELFWDDQKRWSAPRLTADMQPERIARALARAANRRRTS